MSLVTDLRHAALEHETLSPLLNDAADEIARLQSLAGAVYWMGPSNFYSLTGAGERQPMLERIEQAEIAHGGE